VTVSITRDRNPEGICSHSAPPSQKSKSYAFLVWVLLCVLIATAPLGAAPDDVIPVELTTPFVTAAMDTVVGITFRLDGGEAAAGCAYWLLYGTESDSAFFLGTELRLGANAQVLGEMGHLDEDGGATIQIPWPGYADVYYFQAVIARNDQALYQGDAWVTDVLAIRSDGEVWTEWTAPTASDIPSAPKIYVVATDASYPPFEWVGATGTLYGFDLDLMRCIALLQGFEITIKNVDWDAIFDEVADGRADVGASAASITSERESKVDFSAPYWTLDQAVLAREGSGITDIRSLTSGQCAGMLHGSSGYELAVYTLEPDVEIVEYDYLEPAALALAQGGIDVLIVDQPMGQALVAGNPAFVVIDTITTDDDFNFYVGEYGFFVEEGDPQGLLDKLDSSLHTLKEAGVYDNLVRIYMGSTPTEIETAWQESSYFLHERSPNEALRAIQDFADSMVRLTCPTLESGHSVDDEEPRLPSETESADGQGKPDGEPIEGGPGNDPLPEPWSPRKPVILTFLPGDADESACGEAIAEALTQFTGANITWQPASSVEKLIDCFALSDSLVFGFLDAEAYVSLRQELDGDLTPRLVESRYGLPCMYSSVYAYRDRSINSWDDLAGLTWCYPYKESTLGYWLPNLVFEQLGIVSGGTVEAGSHANSMVSLVEHRCDFCTAYGSPPTPPQESDDVWQWGDYVERWVWDPYEGQLVPKTERGTCTDVRSLLLDTYGEEWLLQNIGVVANIGPLPNRSLVFAAGFPADAADRIAQEIQEQMSTEQGRSLWECLGIYEFVPASESEFKCLRELADPSRTAETVTSSCACFPKPVPEPVAREDVESAPEEACAYLRMAWLGAEGKSIEFVDRQLHLPLVITLSSICDDAVDVKALAVADREGQIVDTIWQSEGDPIRVGAGEEVRWYWKTPSLLVPGRYEVIAETETGPLRLAMEVGAASQRAPSASPLQPQQPPVQAGPGEPQENQDSGPYVDDFESQASSWAVGDFSNYGARYSDGEYVIWHRGAGFLRAKSPFGVLGSNLSIEVEVHAEGDSSKRVGLHFQIRADGKFRLFKNNRSPSLIGWTASGAIRRGGAPNLLRVTVFENLVALFVNDSLVASTEVQNVGESIVALTCEGTVTARFDDFRAEIISACGELPPDCVFTDSFEDASSGWPKGEGQSYSADYADGEYAMWVKEGKVLVGTSAFGAIGSNLDVSVDVRLSGSGDGSVGLLWGLDLDNLYLFEVNSAGEYRLRHQEADEWQAEIIPWTEGSSIRPLRDGNRLRVVVLGSLAALFANGELLQAETVPSFGDVEVGLAIYSLSFGEASARFDNFRVCRLAAEE